MEGTELVGEFRSSGYREASRLVGRGDGRIVRLAPVLYSVVTSLDRHAHRQRAEREELLTVVAADVRDETGLDLNLDHIAFLLDRKLAPLGITTDSRGERPTIAKSEAFLSLRFKRPVLPGSATWFLGALFSWLFHPVAVVVVVAAALASEVWLFSSQPMSSALAEALANPATALAVGGLAIGSAFFHEIGHATACRYSGVRPGAIGCGVYLVYPAFYTDITSSYRLERAGRLRTVLGGVYFNAIFIIGLTICYVATGSAFLLAAILIANLELVQQLLPTLRLDGYFIVSDLVGVPDLFKYIGPILKRSLLRRPPDPRLQALKTWPQRVVTMWVLIVTPVLIAQLTFLVLQLPRFLGLAWQKIREIGMNATTPGTDILGLAGDVALMLLALLPVAGLLVFMMQVARGIASIVRNMQTKAAEQEAQGDPVGADQGRGVMLEPTGQVVAAPAHRRQRLLAVRGLGVSIATVLIINLTYLVGRGGSDEVPANDSGPDRTVAIVGLTSYTAPLSRQHVTSPVAYPMTPPVGGDHSPIAQRCDAYDQPVPTEMAVHSMEHGAVWLAYRPELDGAEVAFLRRLADQSHVLVSPFPGLSAPVVATAWGEQLRLQFAYDQRLSQFITRFRQGPQTPEPNVDC